MRRIESRFHNHTTSVGQFHAQTAARRRGIDQFHRNQPLDSADLPANTIPMPVIVQGAMPHHAPCRMPSATIRSAQNHAPGVLLQPGSDDASSTPCCSLACSEFNTQLITAKEWRCPEAHDPSTALIALRSTSLRMTVLFQTSPSNAFTATDPYALVPAFTSPRSGTTATGAGC